MNKSFEKEFCNDLEKEKENYIRAETMPNSNTTISLEKKPTMTILENIIKKTITYNETTNFEKNSISDEEFSKIFEKYKEEKLNSNFICLDDLQPEYLQVRNLKNSENFKSNIKDKFKIEEIEKVTNHILSLKVSFDKPFQSHVILPITLINELIESNFNYNKDYIKEMENLKEKLKDYSHFRGIKNDNNSFYRGVIFQLFELIILNNNIDFLQFLILEIEHIYKSSQAINYLEKLHLKNLINLDLILKILIIIYLNLEENNFEKAYRIFLISINSCKTFDIGLIWYFKFILSQFILDNKVKHYSTKLNITIGSLLPEQYENDGQFLFDQFIEENLLKFNCDVEKIVFYLTPYLFGIDLNIYSEGNIKHYNCEKEEKNINSNFEINIYGEKGHYEILYSNSYFNKFETFLNNYINKNQIKSNILKDNKNNEGKINNISDIENDDIKIKVIDNNNDNDIRNIDKNKNEEIIINKGNINEIQHNKELKNKQKEKKKNIWSSIFLKPNKKETNRNIIIKKGIKKITNFAKKLFKKNKPKNKKNIQTIFKETNLLCENCNIKNSIEKINLCKDCISKLLYNECLLNYNDCIENKIEFDIDNCLFNYKDKQYKIKEILPIIEKDIDTEEYEKKIKSKICAGCQDFLDEKKDIIKFNCGCCFCSKECVKLLYNGKYYPFCNRCKSELFQYKKLFAIFH